jgi:beta-lactamase regulating signal transducer with metallopeptidase domain
MDTDLLLRTSSLLLAALVATRLLHRATPATRHLIWHTAIVAVLLSPVLILVAPRVDIEVPGWVQSPTSLIAPPPSAPIETVPPAAQCDAERSIECDAPPATTQAELRAFATLTWVGTWIVGAWFLLGWLASGWQAARATTAPVEWETDARRLAARLRLAQMPRIRQTRDRGSPKVAGFFHPVILIPESARSWEASDREAALLHELSHIKRADRRTQALAHLTCALYWFNPLAWIAAQALGRERERACDDEVLKGGIRPSAYASLLLDLANARQGWTSAAALGMARPTTIEGRLLGILASDVETSSVGGSARRLSALRTTRWLVFAGSMVVVAVTLGARQPQPPSPDSSRSAGKMGGPALMNLDDRETPSPAMKALVRALGDPDGQVREQAALGLALVPGKETIEPLLTALGDSDSQVREKAAIGLAFRRDTRVVDRLLNAMNDTDAQVREKVAIALGASGDSRAVAALDKALDDPDAQVREKAASGLVLLGLRK